MPNKLMSTVAIAGLGLLPLTLQAAQPDGEQLAKAMKCYACHSVDEPLIGPPYRAIAARHKAEDKALMETVLARKIIHGGGGTWGVVPMVPNEHVSEENAHQLAQWILSL